MVDTRRSLEKGAVLHLDKEYVIWKEIGRGGSCLVYDGFYKDSLSVKHRVRIKECFPCHIEAKRDGRGKIVTEGRWGIEFQRAKEKFTNAYQRNNHLRNIMGLINTAIDSTEIYEDNHTLYTVMSYMEGTDYNRLTESSLKDVFMRIKSLCGIIGKYHEKGFLHLDIKPENMFIPIDTKEQIVLFDFDSMLEIRDFEGKGEILISYSDGFSAPELARGKNIYQAADIYSIGAVVFYKLFGRTPNVWDRSGSAKYDFSGMCFQDERYQPKLFSRMTGFFHKTLSSAPFSRYQDINAVSAALEELAELSDVEGVFLLDSFSYHFSQFVGRREEILQIREALESRDIVFLSGMGGIGKTELAKKFASEFRSQFNRIVFLRYSNSIMETVCSEELTVINCEMNEEDTLFDFYRRKLSALRHNVSKEDLIILDNFDKDDEKFNDLLKCGCKLLVTTREDFWREYGYEQIDIGPLKNESEWREVFRKNNSKEYPKEESEAIDRLLGIFEEHTMTIALFAKYLLHTDNMPSEVLLRTEQKAGIAAAANPPVRHNKDDIHRKTQIYAHLQMLYDMTGFTTMESEILRSFSLLGPIRIKRSVFQQYFEHCQGIEGCLENLIAHGWIEYDKKTEKISLHQIILDLIYHSLRPVSENCPNITDSMISYFKNKLNSRVLKEERRRLAGCFIDRTGGSDYRLANLYYTYCRYVINRPVSILLQKVEQICQCLDSFEGDILMSMIHRLEMESTINGIDWFGFSEEEFEDTLNEIYGKVSKAERNIFSDLRSAMLRNTEIEEYIENEAVLAPYAEDVTVRLLLETAYAVERLGNRICEESLLSEIPPGFGLTGIYSDARRLYQYTCKLAEQKSISYEVKEAVYERMMSFYWEDDILSSVRMLCIGDESKSAYYSERLHEVRNALTGKDVFYIDRFSYEEAAYQAELDGRYEDAVSLYKKALEKKEGLVEDIQYRMGCVYIGLHQYNEAETMFYNVWKLEKERGGHSCAALEKMVEISELQSDTQKTIMYCEQIIQGQLPFSKQGSMEAIAKVLTFSIKKAGWEGSGRPLLDEEEYSQWNGYFRLLDGCQKPERILVTAYKEYANYCWETDSPEEALYQIFSAAEKYRMAYDYHAAREVYECIVNDIRFFDIGQEFYIKSVLGSAKLCAEMEDGGRAMILCRYAEELLEADIPDAAYMEALLRDQEAELYLHSELYRDMDQCIDRMKQCDYYLLAERKTVDTKSGSALEEWGAAADNYMYIGDYDMAAQCLERMKTEAEKEGTLIGFQRYYFACLKWDRESSRTDSLLPHINAIYKKLVSYIKKSGGMADPEVCLEVMETIGSIAFEKKEYFIALYSCMISVLIILDGDWMNRLEIIVELSDEKWLKDCIGKVESFFPEKIDTDKLDDVIREIERMLEGIKGNARFEEFYDKLCSIEKRYKSTDVEYKRQS